MMRTVVFMALLIAGLFTAVGCDSPDPGTVDWIATQEAEAYELDAWKYQQTVESGAAAFTTPAPQTTVTALQSIDEAAPAPVTSSASDSDDSDLVQLRFANDMPSPIEIRIVGTTPAPDSEHTTVEFGALDPGEVTEYKAPPGLLDQGDTWAFLIYVDGEIRPKETGCSNCEWFSVGEPYKRWTITFYTDNPEAQYFLYPPGVRVIADF